jgi:hypothetical protein
MKKAWIVVLVIAAAVAAYLLFVKGKPAPTGTPSPTVSASGSPAATTSPAGSPVTKVVNVTLAEQSNSNESGKAMLKEVNGKVVVTVTVTGEPSGASQPAHIHTGVCPTPGAVLYPLTNVVNGSSETTLSVSMAQLMAAGPIAINLHKSAAEPSVYVACGNVVF